MASLECEVHIDGIRLEHVSEFRYLGCVLDELGTDGAECSRKVRSGRRMVSAIKSLVNARVLQLECARVLHETLLVSVLMYGSETRLWKEKERSRIRAVHIDNLRGLTRCNSFRLSQLYEACGWKSVYCRDYNLRCIKLKTYFFSFLS